MKRNKSCKLFFIIITIFLIVINISTVNAYIDKNSEEYKLREEEAKQIINSANPYPSSTVGTDRMINSYNNSLYDSDDYDTGKYINISKKVFSLAILFIIIVVAILYLSMPIFLKIKGISFYSKKTLILFILMYSLNIYSFISIFYLLIYGKGLASLLLGIIFTFISYFILKNSINNIPTEYLSNTNKANNLVLNKILNIGILFDFWFIPFGIFALHCYSTYIIQKSDGFWAALVGFCLPLFSEIYCAIITILEKGFLNTYTQFLLILILIGFSTGITNYLINEKNK